jgi:hypothetical protein
METGSGSTSGRQLDKLVEWKQKQNRNGNQMDIDLSRLIFDDIKDARNAHRLIGVQRQESRIDWSLYDDHDAPITRV